MRDLGTIKKDFDAVKPKLYSKFIPYIQRMAIPDDPIEDYMRCLQTLKIMSIKTPNAPGVRETLERYRLNK